MKIAITATGPTLEDRVDPRFGRCSWFLVVDPETLEFEALENPHGSLGGGAGIQSAQLMAERNVGAVLTGNCGPNAHRVLTGAGIEVISGCGGAVSEAIADFAAGRLRSAEGPSVESKFGVAAGAAGAAGGDDVERLNEAAAELSGRLQELQKRIALLEKKQ
ncbi:MAG TPA: NifB/NifX family molybdenum-iron cluster-binding protein [bacterium]|nr:NifB/NifX family molybdenum-iron cluster-binding protein [bacterium]HPQ67362.1 NifB/NifX family molybdenum-iron cluster-binding protein [bacterium]